MIYMGKERAMKYIIRLALLSDWLNIRENTIPQRTITESFYSVGLLENGQNGNPQKVPKPQ